MKATLVFWFGPNLKLWFRPRPSWTTLNQIYVDDFDYFIGNNSCHIFAYTAYFISDLHYHPNLHTISKPSLILWELWTKVLLFLGPLSEAVSWVWFVIAHYSSELTNLMPEIQCLWWYIKKFIMVQLQMILFPVVYQW